MTPLICEESWHEWPAKYWSECFTEVFLNWLNSLATGDATIGSYAIAAVLGMVILSVVIINGVEDWFAKRPRASIWARFGLLNLLPTAIAIVFIYGWISTGVWDKNDAEAAGIIIAVYYAFVGLIIAFSWNAKRRAEKRNAQRK
jgi:hypothetical protein